MTTRAEWLMLRADSEPSTLITGEDEPTFYRIRLLYGRWYICLFTDVTCNNCIGDYGPYYSVLSAKQAVTNMNAISIDAMEEPKS